MTSQKELIPTNKTSNMAASQIFGENDSRDKLILSWDESEYEVDSGSEEEQRPGEDVSGKIVPYRFEQGAESSDSGGQSEKSDSEAISFPPLPSDLGRLHDTEC